MYHDKLYQLIRDRYNENQVPNIVVDFWNLILFVNGQRKGCRLDHITKNDIKYIDYKLGFTSELVLDNDRGPTLLTRVKDLEEEVDYNKYLGIKLDYPEPMILEELIVIKGGVHYVFIPNENGKTYFPDFFIDRDKVCLYSFKCLDLNNPKINEDLERYNNFFELHSLGKVIIEY
jgi:hypothetical protein